MRTNWNTRNHYADIHKPNQRPVVHRQGTTGKVPHDVVRAMRSEGPWSARQIAQFFGLKLKHTEDIVQGLLYAKVI